MFATQPEDSSTVEVRLGPLRSLNAKLTAGVAGYPPGTTAEALSCGVWVFTSVPGSGSCSLTCAGYCGMVYGEQKWVAPAEAKVAPPALTTSQQISYEPGVSAGLMRATVVLAPGATVLLMATAGPVVSGVPVPLVLPDANTRAARPYPLHVLVPVLVRVTAIRPDWLAIGTVS